MVTLQVLVLSLWVRVPLVQPSERLYADAVQPFFYLKISKNRKIIVFYFVKEIFCIIFAHDYHHQKEKKSKSNKKQT